MLFVFIKIILKNEGEEARKNFFAIFNADPINASFSFNKQANYAKVSLLL